MANLAPVVMPKWGMEMTEGELAEWHVAVGDSINAGGDVVDVETAKIVNTVTSNSSGEIVRLCAAIGDVVPVGGLLAVVADGAVSDAEIDAFIATLRGSNSAVAPALEPRALAPEPELASNSVPTPQTAPVKSALSAGGDDSSVPASAVARRVAKDNNINLSNVSGTGRHGRISLADLRAAASAAGVAVDLPEARQFAAPPAGENNSDYKVTPVARRLAEQLGVKLSDCRSTGRHGRISKADVEAAAARQNKLAPVSSASADTTAQRSDEVTLERLTGARRTIAKVVSQAKSEVPHFRVNVDIDVSAAMRLRNTLNNHRSDIKVSLNDIVIKACAMALANNPGINARFDGQTLERHSQAHISSAVATDNGVLMPVLRNANSLGLGEISTAMRDLATRAKSGRLTMDEMGTATFSISNLGMFGIDSFDAIINQPAVTILAVGAAKEQPVVRDGQLGIGLMMSVSLASDHRVVDGADAARFLTEVKDMLEEPALMLG